MSGIRLKLSGIDKHFSKYLEQLGNLPSYEEFANSEIGTSCEGVVDYESSKREELFTATTSSIASIRVVSIFLLGTNSFTG